MTTASWRGGGVERCAEAKERVKERRGGVQEGGMEGRGGRRGQRGTEKERGVVGLGRWSVIFFPSEIEEGIAAINFSLSSLPLPVPTFSITPWVVHIATTLPPAPHTTPHQYIVPLCKSDKFPTEGRRGINKEGKMRKGFEASGFCREEE